MTDYTFQSAIRDLQMKAVGILNSVVADVGSEKYDHAAGELTKAIEAITEMKRKITEKKKSEGAAKTEQKADDGITTMDYATESKAKGLAAKLDIKAPKECQQAASEISKLADTLAADKKTKKEVLAQLAKIIGAYAGGTSKSEIAKGIKQFVERIARTSGQVNF